MQAAILERVSTEEQVNGYGLETQDDACRAYVGGKDWSLVDVYADAKGNEKRTTKYAVQNGGVCPHEEGK